MRYQFSCATTPIIIIIPYCKSVLFFSQSKDRIDDIVESIDQHSIDYLASYFNPGVSSALIKYVENLDKNPLMIAEETVMIALRNHDRMTPHLVSFKLAQKIKFFLNKSDAKEWKKIIGVFVITYENIFRESLKLNKTQVCYSILQCYEEIETLLTNNKANYSYSLELNTMMASILRDAINHQQEGVVQSGFVAIKSIMILNLTINSPDVSKIRSLNRISAPTTYTKEDAQLNYHWNAISSYFVETIYRTTSYAIEKRNTNILSSGLSILTELVENVFFLESLKENQKRVIFMHCFTSLDTLIRNAVKDDINPEFSFSLSQLTQSLPEQIINHNLLSIVIIDGLCNLMCLKQHKISFWDIDSIGLVLMRLVFPVENQKIDFSNDIIVQSLTALTNCLIRIVTTVSKSEIEKESKYSLIREALLRLNETQKRLPDNDLKHALVEFIKSQNENSKYISKHDE